MGGESGTDFWTLSTRRETVGVSDITVVVPEAIDSVSDGENAAVIGADGRTLSDMRGAEFADVGAVIPSDGATISVPNKLGPREAIVHKGEDEGMKDMSTGGRSGRQVRGTAEMNVSGVEDDRP